MVAVYFSRRLAAIHAMRKGLKAFQTFQPMPAADRNCWAFEERPEGPGIEYARMFAEGKDFIHHVEVDDKKIPILVVSCFREEIIEEIPSLFRIEPLTPELWAAARREYPDTRPYKTPSLVANPARPLPNAVSVMKPVNAPTGEATAPVASVSLPVATGVPPSRRAGGAKAICREVYMSMPGAVKKDVIAACVARGVFIGTAAARYTDIRREIEGE